ncbi:hypothetical protein PSTG_04032 [Puccinia striiformis f. sp. tritici PST-78]|uniref:Uncharacterized protein n=1 Tax=Puccinia striiformis f. sp. tritici PST-78 TaxID=1165861 RepID=A0A0L0VU56_9BASI|nr:hypothetical protein PSTG_04032 [Puccinia striiformis f. sp. tritici PST-78]
MWHWSAVSSEIIRLRTPLFLIYTAIAIAGASEELTQRSCHQLRGIPPALSNWGREKIHLDKHTYFANPGENELLFPARMNEHEEHAAVGGATRGYLAGYAREAPAMHTINHHIDHQAAPPLFYKEVQGPSKSFHNHLQGNNCMTHDSLEAFNAISASDRLEEGSSGNFLEVSDYMAAGLVDDTYVNFDFGKFDDYLNPEEGITPFSGHSSVHESDSVHFSNTKYVQFDPTKFSLPPTEERRAARSSAEYQRDKVSGDGYLAGYPHKAQTIYTVDHHINHRIAPPLISKETQEPSRGLHNHAPGNNCMAYDPLEAINSISTNDQSEEFSIGNPLAVSDYVAAGLIDDTFLYFDGYFDPREAISPFRSYSGVQEWDAQDFLNPQHVQSDSTGSSLAPAQERHTTSPTSYQGNQDSGDSNKVDKPWSPDLDNSTGKRGKDNISKGVISLTSQSKRNKRKSFQSLESPDPIENFEQSEQVGKKRKSFQSLYSLQPMDNFRQLTLMDILNCKNIPQPIIESLRDISKLLSQEVKTGDITLQDGEFKKICVILRRKLTYAGSVGTRDKCFINKFNSYMEDPHSSYIDRYGLTKTESKDYNSDNMKLYELTKLFPAFLNLVEIILTVIPWPKEQLELTKEKKFDFFKEMTKAAQFFEDFITYVMSSVSKKKDKDNWKVTKYQILSTSGKRRHIYTLWRTLELWMKTHHKFIWKHLTFAPGDAFTPTFKEFFNNIFFHGIEDLTEIILSHKSSISTN